MSRRSDWDFEIGQVASDADPAQDEAEPRLRRMGPMDGGGFGIELEGGPIHGFAAYLIELMTGPKGELWNCMETEVQASGGRGSFTLTIQRRNGKTPLQLRTEAEALLKVVLEAIESGRSEPLFIARDTIRNYFADRDTDGSPEGRDAKRLDGEAATAGAEGIAQPIDPLSRIPEA